MAGVTWVTKQMSATVGLSPWQNRPLVGCSAINVADSHPLIVPRVRHYLTDVPKVSDDQRLAWIQHWLGAGLQAIETLHQCEPAHPGPRMRIGGQQRRLRVLLVEIFENSQRLEQLDVTVDHNDILRNHYIVASLFGRIE
jgi:hypothetical protein